MTSTSHLNADYLVKAYESGVSGYRLSKELGVSLWAILARLRGAGVTIRPSGVRNRLDLPPEDSAVLGELTDGLLLGDGSVSEKKPYLRVEQSDSRLGWLEDLRYTLRSFGLHVGMTPIPPRTKVVEGREVSKGSSTVLYTSVCEEFREERRRWYPEGVKRVPTDVHLTPLSLAQWFSGDGTGRRDGGLELCTNGFLQEDVNLLARELKRQVGVHSTVGKTVRPGQFRLQILRKDEAVRFRDLVQPLMSGCCLYKLKHVRPAIRWKRLSDEAAQEIRTLRKEGLLLKELGHRFGVSPQAISAVCREQ